MRASSRSTTSLPSAGRREPHELDVVARRRLVGDEGVGGVDAEPGLARAGGRAAPQPGELLAQEVVAALGGDAGHPLALGLGEHVGRVAALVGVHLARVDLPRLGRDGVEEPPVVGDRDDGVVRAGRAGVTRWSASQATPSTSRWLVGSSRRSRSGDATSSAGERDPAALATGQRADGRGHATDVRGVEAAEEPGEHVAHARVGGPDVLLDVAEHGGSRTVEKGSSASSWASTPTVSPPTRATRPESTSRSPASTRSRVVLPPPLRPTTPIRSPPPTPRERASSTWAVPSAREARSTETRLATSRSGGG